MHLFLSPHFDDAALSCGGQIAELTRQGERVVIFTVMGAEPPIGFQHTPFTQELQDRWGLGDSPVLGRRAEDLAAGKVLGAEVEFGPYADAVFRIAPDTGKVLYPDVEAIFAEIHPDDTVNRTAQAMSFDLLPTDVIHAPLGVGHHVDHQLVRDMALALAQIYPDNEIFFYEEYPYTQEGDPAVHTALEVLEATVTPLMVPISLEAIETRIKAVACHKSQLSSFAYWDTPDAMFAAMRRESQQAGGEREWRLVRIPQAVDDAASA
jgi:LmbE family N-acetylglucosaminyl deacetylase